MGFVRLVMGLTSGADIGWVEDSYQVKLKVITSMKSKNKLQALNRLQT